MRPAVTAVYGAPVDVAVGLWHGLTPMLALSATVLGIGALIFVKWDRLHARLRALNMAGIDMEHAWEVMLRRLDALPRAAPVTHAQRRLRTVGHFASPSVASFFSLIRPRVAQRSRRGLGFGAGGMAGICGMFRSTWSIRLCFVSTFFAGRLGIFPCL